MLLGFLGLVGLLGFHPQESRNARYSRTPSNIHFERVRACARGGPNHRDCLCPRKGSVRRHALRACCGKRRDPSFSNGDCPEHRVGQHWLAGPDKFVDFVRASRRQTDMPRSASPAGGRGRYCAPRRAAGVGRRTFPFRPAIHKHVEVSIQRGEPLPQFRRDGNRLGQTLRRLQAARVPSMKESTASRGVRHTGGGSPSWCTPPCVNSRTWDRWM